jgi:hypothetical protein
MSAMGDEMEREKSNILVVKTFSPNDDSYDLSCNQYICCTNIPHESIFALFVAYE